MAGVLILHGLHGNGDDHWQRWLHARLEEDGVPVRSPDLPACDEPCPDRWGGTLDLQLRWLGRCDGVHVVVCHSLACVLWLRHAARGAVAPPVDLALLVAPPSAAAGAPELEGFFPHGASREDVAAAARRTELVCGDEDPWCPEGADVTYGVPLQLPTSVLPGAGHINVDAGFGPWPDALERVRSRLAPAPA